MISQSFLYIFFLQLFMHRFAVALHAVTAPLGALFVAGRAQKSSRALGGYIFFMQVAAAAPMHALC
jgi:hypothetical protein